MQQLLWRILCTLLQTHTTKWKNHFIKNKAFRSDQSSQMTMWTWLDLQKFKYSPGTLYQKAAIVVSWAKIRLLSTKKKKRGNWSTTFKCKLLFFLKCEFTAYAIFKTDTVHVGYRSLYIREWNCKQTMFTNSISTTFVSREEFYRKVVSQRFESRHWEVTPLFSSINHDPEKYVLNSHFRNWHKLKLEPQFTLACQNSFLQSSSHLPGRNRSQDVPVLFCKASFHITPQSQVLCSTEYYSLFFP